MRTTLAAFATFAFIFALSLIFSCRKEKATSKRWCGKKIYSFTSDVLPILQTRCAISQCHVAGGLAPYDATDYNQIMPYAADDRLVRAIKHEGPIAMPRIDPLQPTAYMLPDSCLCKIECWVLQGYPNN